MTPSQLGSSYDQALNEIGFTVRFTEWTQNVGSYPSGDYDEATFFRISGTGHSGAAAIFPIGPAERQFQKYGALSMADSRMFVTGSLVVNETTEAIFPNGSVYGILPGGVRPFGVSGTTIYQECFMRIIPGGSPYGRA